MAILKSDSRCCDDRRNREIGPPTGRRSVERRLPEVRELAFSDWLIQLRGYLAKSSKDDT